MLGMHAWNEKNFKACLKRVILYTEEAHLELSKEIKEGARCIEKKALPH